MKAHVFVDTNVALHFKRPEEVDWRRLTGCDTVYLVATQTLLHEIQEKIHTAGSRRLRRRADRFARDLDTYIDDPDTPVRDGVYWRFIDHSPNIDFRTHQLVEGVNDDHLIAAVLCYADYEEGDRVCVATDDRSLRVKLKPRHIEVLQLPKNYLLPDEADPTEQELSRVKQELARERDRAPALALQARTGAAFIEAAVGAPDLSDVPDLAEVKRQHEKLHRPGEPSEAENPFEAVGRTAQRMQLLGVRDYQVEYYNRKLDAFYERYEKYLGNLEEWRRRMSCLVPIEVKLVNDGRGPANNIHVTLTFPEHVVLYGADDAPKRPEAPEPPRKPSIADLGVGLLSQPEIHRMMDYGLGPPRVDAVPRIALFSKEVTVCVNALTHTFEKPIDLFYASLEDAPELRSFAFDYDIIADETPEPITGRIHIKLEDQV